MQNDELAVYQDMVGKGWLPFSFFLDSWRHFTGQDLNAAVDSLQEAKYRWPENVEFKTLLRSGRPSVMVKITGKALD